MSDTLDQILDRIESAIDDQPELANELAMMGYTSGLLSVALEIRDLLADILDRLPTDKMVGDLVERHVDLIAFNRRGGVGE